MKNRIIQFRLRILQYLFRTSGIENICGHWVYTKILNNQSHIVDLGANQGDFAKIMLNRFNSKLYLVEPNLMLLDSINIKCVKMNSAVTNVDGPIKFYQSKNNEASSIIENFQNRWENDKVVEVDGISWKTLTRTLQIEEAINIDVLKIDIEGAELELIENFDLLDASMISQITVEFHDWLDEDLHLRTVAAIKKIKSLGYISFCSTPNHNWPVEMLFVKKGLMRPNLTEKISLSLLNKFSFLKYIS